MTATPSHVFDTDDNDLSHLPASSTRRRDTGTGDDCLMCQGALSRDIPVVRVAPDRFAHLECYSGLPFVLHPAVVLEFCAQDYGAHTWFCYYCNRPFVAPRRMLYCSTDCKVHAVNERRQAPRSTRTCSECGDTFKPARSDATTCSPRCRQRRRRRLSRLPAGDATTRNTGRVDAS